MPTRVDVATARRRRADEAAPTADPDGDAESGAATAAAVAAAAPLGSPGANHRPAPSTPWAHRWDATADALLGTPATSGCARITRVAALLPGLLSMSCGFASLVVKAATGADHGSPTLSVMYVIVYALYIPPCIITLGEASGLRMRPCRAAHALASVATSLSSHGNQQLERFARITHVLMYNLVGGSVVMLGLATWLWRDDCRLMASVHAVLPPIDAACDAGLLDASYAAWVTLSLTAVAVSFSAVLVNIVNAVFLACLAGVWVTDWGAGALQRVDAATEAVRDADAASGAAIAEASASTRAALAARAALLDEWLRLRERFTTEVIKSIEWLSGPRGVGRMGAYAFVVYALLTVVGILLIVVAPDANTLVLGLWVCPAALTMLAMVGAALALTNMQVVVLRRAVSSRPPPPLAPAVAAYAAADGGSAPPSAAVAQMSAAYATQRRAASATSASPGEAPDVTDDAGDTAVQVVAARRSAAVVAPGIDVEAAKQGADMSLRTTLAMSAVEEHLATAVTFVGLRLVGTTIITLPLLQAVISAMVSVLVIGLSKAGVT